MVDLQTAQQRVHDFLTRQLPLERMSAAQCKELDCAAAWEATLFVRTKTQEIVEVPIQICLPADFPFALPRICITPKLVQSLGYPLHINTAGLVCTHESTTHPESWEEVEAIVDDVLKRTRDIIIEAYDTTPEERDYSDEYLAYWRQEYGKDDTVICNCLSVLDEDEEPETEIRFAVLSKPYGAYKYILYSSRSDTTALFANLAELGIEISYTPAFYIGDLNLPTPPFKMSHQKALDLIKQAVGSNAKAYRRYVNRTQSKPTIIFRTWVANRALYFGWQLQDAALKSGQRRAFNSKKVCRFDQIHMHNQHRTVIRLCSEDARPERLLRRTMGSTREGAADLKTMIIGLGSVGSHLAQHLSRMPHQQLILVDPEPLKVENVGRHLLGIEYSRSFKVKGVASFLRRSHAASSVTSTFPTSIVELVRKAPEQLAECANVMVCIGVTATERWLDTLRSNQEGVRGAVFYFWVEPFLVGGHCLYMPPKSPQRFDDFFKNGLFNFNVISPTTYATRNFTHRELGCETAFIPYSGAHVDLFLCGIINDVTRLMREQPHSPMALTWIGDAEVAKHESIELAPYAVNQKMGTVLRHIL